VDQDESSPVLLVANDDDLLDVLSFAFEQDGHRTCSLRRGAEAVGLVEGGSVGAVVLDLRSARAHGADLARAARARRLPLIVLAGEDDPELSTIGSARVVPKPVSPQTLLEQLGDPAVATAPTGPGRGRAARVEPGTGAAQAAGQRPAGRTQGPAGGIEGGLHTATGGVLVAGGAHVALAVQCATDPALRRQPAARRPQAPALVPAVLRYAVDLAHAVAASGATPKRIEVDALVRPPLRPSDPDAAEAPQPYPVQLAVRGVASGLDEASFAALARATATRWSAATHPAWGAVAAEVTAMLAPPSPAAVEVAATLVQPSPATAAPPGPPEAAVPVGPIRHLSRRHATPAPPGRAHVAARTGHTHAAARVGGRMAGALLVGLAVVLISTLLARRVEAPEAPRASGARPQPTAAADEPALGLASTATALRPPSPAEDRPPPPVASPTLAASAPAMGPLAPSAPPAVDAPASGNAAPTPISQPQAAPATGAASARAATAQAESGPTSTAPAAAAAQPPEPSGTDTVGEPVQRVIEFYRLLGENEFEQLPPLLSGHLRDSLPADLARLHERLPAGRLVVRRAELASVDATQNHAVVAVEVEEQVPAPLTTTREYVGQWQLERGPAGWLLDEPDLQLKVQGTSDR
jgi:CheY-like chemotaxis protein